MQPPRDGIGRPAERSQIVRLQQAQPSSRRQIARRRRPCRGWAERLPPAACRDGGSSSGRSFPRTTGIFCGRRLAAARVGLSERQRQIRGGGSYHRSPPAGPGPARPSVGGSAVAPSHSSGPRSKRMMFVRYRRQKAGSRFKACASRQAISATCSSPRRLASCSASATGPRFTPGRTAQTA